MARSVSLKDIASKVGVSAATVSYVLNGLEKEKRVSAEMVKKVQQVAKELNYKPNQIASSLRKGTTNSIGLIVADISNPFFGQLARIIEDEAALFNYTVIFGSSDGDSSKSETLINTFCSRKVDGLLIVPSEDSFEQIDSLIKEGIPTVLIDRYIPGLNINHVVLDNYKATYSAVEHFISNGYKKISMIAYNSSLTHMKERVRGYCEAMQDNGLAEEITVREVHYDNVKNEMEIIMTELLNGKKSNALLFASNNLTISGLYLIKKFKIIVPYDLAVIGFDGHEVYDFFQPQLTYIQQPLEKMGRESIKLLLNQIQGSKRIVHVELKHKLIIRASSG